MDKKDLIYLASIVIGKGLSYEDMMYSDYLYGKENLIDDVWEFVEECQKIGEIAFAEKYKEYKLY